MDLILLVSCCLLLLLETVITEHAKWLNYFEEIAVLEKQELKREDIQEEWGYNQQSVNTLTAAPVLTKKEEPVIYKESTLTSEHEDFFASLMKTEDPGVRMEEPFGFETDGSPFEQEPPVTEAFQEWERAEEVKIQEDLDAQEESEREHYLTMEDWEESPAPTNVNSQLSATASHKINDGYIGEQLWVVEVVGYEQSYVHVSDGETRTWINIRKFNSIHKGDILSVLVHRDISDQVDVLDIDILQQKSFDFEMEENLDSNEKDVRFAM